VFAQDDPNEDSHTNLFSHGEAHKTVQRVHCRNRNGIAIEVRYVFVDSPAPTQSSAQIEFPVPTGFVFAARCALDSNNRKTCFYPEQDALPTHHVASRKCIDSGNNVCIAHVSR
jgi:hypothetical protein